MKKIYNSYRTDFRICCKCNQEKPVTEYSGKTSTYCKPCFNNYRKQLKERWKNNPEWKTRERHQTKEKRQERRKYYIEYLKTHPCVKCGESDPIVLEFNHIDPSTKIDLVSTMCHQGKLDDMINEIKKCEVLCANCHKRVTAKQMNWFWVEDTDTTSLTKSKNNLNPYRQNKV